MPKYVAIRSFSVPGKDGWRKFPEGQPVPSDLVKSSKLVEKELVQKDENDD